MAGSAKNLPSADQVLNSRAVVLAPNCCTVEALTRRLRRGVEAVVGRIHRVPLLLDKRTVRHGEVELGVRALGYAAEEMR